MVTTKNELVVLSQPSPLDRGGRRTILLKLLGQAQKVAKGGDKAKYWWILTRDCSIKYMLEKSSE